MKKILKTLAILIALIPTVAFAQINVNQGGTGTTTFQSGTILFGSTAFKLTSSISLFWDNTLKRLGIGTSSPAWKLSVAGNASFDDYVRSSFFTATSTTATSTLPITSINRISANTSAGVDVDSLTGSHVANFGVGSSQNSLFYGGVNIDGSTRLATSLTGPLQAISGSVTSTSTLSTFYGGTGITTRPSYGEVLVGNSSGTYTLTATSSLGISGGASLSGGSPNTMTYWTSGSTVGATSSPTVGYITATTTTANRFAGNVDVRGTGVINVGSATTNVLTIAGGGSANLDSLVSGRPLSFSIVGTEVGRFNSPSGNFGIGTTSPYAKLSVAGEVVGQNFTSTSTSATSTLPQLTGSLISGYGLSSCTGTSNKVTYADGTFRCEADQTGAGGTIDGAGVAGMMTSWTDSNTVQATSTIVGATIIATSTTATSTFANGLNITGGCFAINGTCFSGGSYGDSNVNSYINSSSTIPKTYTANTFSALQTIPYASTTMITATTASSTQFIAGFGDVSNPAYTFSGSTNNGMYLVSAGNVSIAAAGNRVFNFNNSFNTSYRDLFGNTSKTFKLEADAGSATTPTYSFDTDGNTGIWSSGADSLNLTTGGTDRLTIDSSGLVTLGNASTTVLSATSICLTGDLPCRTTWPSGGSSASTTALSDNNTFSGINSFTTTSTTTFVGPVVTGTIETKTFPITSLTSAGDFGAVWKVPRNITILGVRVIQEGATNVVGQLQNCNSSGASCTDVDSSDITATTGEATDDGSLSSPSITGGNYIGWKTTSVSGTNTRVSVTFYYK